MNLNVNRLISIKTRTWFPRYSIFVRVIIKEDRYILNIRWNRPYKKFPDRILTEEIRKISITRSSNFTNFFHSFHAPTIFQKSWSRYYLYYYLLNRIDFLVQKKRIAWTIFLARLYKINRRFISHDKATRRIFTMKV